MRFKIEHEIKGRIRVHMMQHCMSYEQADTLQYYLTKLPFISKVKVYERTGNAVITYEGSRENVIDALKRFHYEDVKIPEGIIENSGREMNARYKEKLVTKVAFRYLRKWILPAPLRACFIGAKACKYIAKGMKSLSKGRLEVSVLDATAIGVSMLRRDIKTAGSVMFLLGIGELLEEWTHKKSVGDLARSLSLNIDKVWLKSGEQEILVDASEIVRGNMIVVHMGNIIPFDGVVVAGEAVVNQSSMTGESEPVRKTVTNYVYAGTVLEEGELTIEVKENGGGSRFEKIVTMIEDTERLKSSAESKAEHLADKLVPYTLAGTVLTYFLTRNVTKALSVLMVDFSCALKLAMPISVLSAIREASSYNITVKGGKFLEAVAEADTIVFDKTGTLTMAEPRVADLISFNGMDKDELLRIAACMEEHFPHSMAKAVVDAAREKNLEHEEMHSKVEYIVAHGISTAIEGKRTIIGSYHFVFEDEGCHVPEGMESKFREIPEEYSRLYLAIEGELAAVICIKDPLREEAADVVRALKGLGISKVVMMTGDSEKTAKAIAEMVGVDEYYSEVLPEDKAKYVEKEKNSGRKVIMVGDGINDSPALSAADVGIAIGDGAQIAKEIADITICADDLHELVTLRKLSESLMKRIKKNYRRIVGVNTGLIGMGVTGVMQPTTSALFHNATTLAIGVESMNNLLT